MSKKHVGIICIVISAFFFSLMNVFVRLSGDLPVFQKSVFRNLVAVVVALVILLKEKPEVNLDRGDKTTLFFRSLFGTAGILCNYYAVDHLLLADASILGKLSPFFALLMGVLLLKEKISGFQIGAVVVAFAGAVLVIKPGAGVVSYPAVIGAIGGLVAGTAYTLVRKAGMRGIPGPFIVFFFSAFSCIAILPFMIATYKPMTLSQLVFLLLAGLSAAIAQFAVTTAYCNAPAREISIFDYSQIIFAAIMGFIIFGQVPDIWSWAGYMVIFVTAMANFIYNRKKSEN